MSAEVKHPQGNVAQTENGAEYGANGGIAGYQGTGGAVSRFCSPAMVIYKTVTEMAEAEAEAARDGLVKPDRRIDRQITPGGNPIDNSQPAFPVYHRRFANPAPLGLLGFAATTFILSMYNVRARGITTPNVVLGMALGYGGLVQLIAGVEEWACGNTFGATAFSSYGGFWFSFAALYIPQFGIADAYTVEGEFASAVGIYLISWALVTLLFFIASLRSSIALVSLFGCLDITFWLLAAGELAPSLNATKAGGVFGIITAFIAMYTALAGMLTKDTSHFLIPVGNLARASK